MSSTHTNLGAMNDGRAFTSYSDVCALNSAMLNKAGVQSWDMHAYKENMQKSGLKWVQHHQGTCGPLPCEDLGKGVPTSAPVQYTGPAPYDDGAQFAKN